MSSEVSLFLADEAATLALGHQLGQALRAGDVVGLVGELGAGKTTLVHGLAAALGVTGPVPSPTFVLMREHVGRERLVHVDAYRLGGAEDAWAIGLDEHLPGDGVTVIEWADRIAELLPDETLWVRLQDDGNGRRAAVAGPDRLVKVVR